MERALVRFGRFVNDQEGDHRGDAYISLAKFILDSRRGGSGHSAPSAVIAYLDDLHALVELPP
jgi:hypothetical protein